MATTAIEGLVGQLSLGGTIVGLLTGVTLSGNRSQTPWRAMGTYDATQILKGRRNYEGTARKAYLCGDWLDLFALDKTEFAATLYPRGTTGCGTIAGSIAIKNWNIAGLETESEAAVLDEIAFDMYQVTTP